MREKGQLTLPSLFRKALGLKAGDYFEVNFQDNVIVLKPCKPMPKDIPADEAWYWTEEWQEKEHRARRDIHEGRVKSFDNIDDFIKDLRTGLLRKHSGGAVAREHGIRNTKHV
ncbi:AbrB/MazE/SpoVT family DNA-binding domain-containing protein [Candidatus Poribacteria bacterium]|nr:AbrB/MazE/SpoVT family DNA-binding domain-containing protein [Candidatus Poribacteria bacterium]